MPLPEEYLTARMEDVNMRIRYSFIEYDGCPVFVMATHYVPTGNGRGAKTVIFRDTNLEEHTVAFDDPLLNVKDLGCRLGYISDQGTVIHLSRVPNRAFSQGLTFNNTSIGMKVIHAGDNSITDYAFNNLYGRYYGGHGISRLNTDDFGRTPSRAVRRVAERSPLPNNGENYLYILNCPGFLQMWNNNYPSIEYVMSQQRAGLYAIGRRYIIDTTKNPAEVWHQNAVIGTVNAQHRLDLNVPKQFLAEDIRENTAIRLV